MDSFPCNGCGLCCMRAGKYVQIARELVAGGNDSAYVKEVAAFPYDFDPVGLCSKLDAEHRCSVYEDRPDICRVDVIWEKYHKEFISKEGYFIAAAKECNTMMAEVGLSEQWYIKHPALNFGQ